MDTIARPRAADGGFPEQSRVFSDQHTERPPSDRDRRWGVFFGRSERDRHHPLRRVWNWPLRIGLAVWLATALLSRWVSGPVIEDLFTIDFAILCVWVGGFLWRMAQDLRRQK